MMLVIVWLSCNHNLWGGRVWFQAIFYTLIQVFCCHNYDLGLEMVTALKIFKNLRTMEICNLTFSYAMFTCILGNKNIFVKCHPNLPKIIPCLVSHLILSQVWVKKGKILFCLLAENQGVPGHECPTLRGKLCSCSQINFTIIPELS